MTAADQVISVALAQVGKPYIFGHKGPDSFDCSGLVLYAFKKGANIDLPHFTGSMWNRGTKVGKDQLAPGDLVFPDLGHVQIYIGNGKVVEAPSAGQNVKVSNMWGFFGARRIIAPGSAVNPGTGGGTVNVGNPVEDAYNSIKGLVELFRSIDDAFKWITDANNWKRIGAFTVGLFLIFFAVLRWDGTKDVAKEITQGVSK